MICTQRRLHRPDDEINEIACETSRPTIMPTPTPSSELMIRLRSSTRWSKNDMRAPASSSACAGETGVRLGGCRHRSLTRMCSGSAARGVCGNPSQFGRARPAAAEAFGRLRRHGSASVGWSGVEPAKSGAAAGQRGAADPALLRCLAFEIAQMPFKGGAQSHRLRAGIPPSPCPRLRASSGSFSGPKTTRATTKMIMR